MVEEIGARSASGTARVFALYIYPVKGARGLAIERSDVLRAGLRHDRQFMVVDERGHFLTQREHPRMALLETAIEDGELRLACGLGRVSVPLDVDGSPRSVTVWKDDVVALDAGPEPARLLSAHLGLACSLVRMPSTTIRRVDRDHGREGDHVGFADGFPVLVASLASLADLNARLDVPVGIDRFRANVVIDGVRPWEEETATAMTIGALAFRTPKKCTRCVVVTTDQLTGEVGKEPLRTLGTFRRDGSKVCFAMNAIPDEEGALAIGDPVRLSGPSRRPS